jgi:hypothetical protein
MERVRPPSPDSAIEIIGDAQGLQERLERVARELFAFYERGGPHIEVDVRERRLPGMSEWEAQQRETVAALVREALDGTHSDARTVRLVSAFFDLPTFKALRTRGVAPRTAAKTVAQIAVCLLESGRQRNSEEEQ